MATNARVLFRRDTAANWTSADPTLLSGEVGFETDTGKFKVGDGATAWTSLGYAASGLIDVVDDTTPQLGGDLDVNGNAIVSTANGNIAIIPDGTGNVELGNFVFDADQTVGAGQDGYVLTYDDGAGLIALQAAASSAVDSVNGQTGAVVLDADDIDDSATTNKFATAAEKTKLAGIEAGAEVNTIDSDPTGITGADQITNVVSLTTAEYGAITPDASTLYIITDAT